MPLYNYNCLDCEEQVDIRHAYKAINVRCIKCDSQNIKKNLSSVLQVTKKCYNIKEQTGSQVKKAIDDGKQELKDFKKNQKNRIYKKKQ
jgi:putative FmdB family regulatory protein